MAILSPPSLMTKKPNPLSYRNDHAKLRLVLEKSTVDGYDNLMPKKLAAALSVIGSERATAGTSSSPEALDIKTNDDFIDRLPVMGRLGIKYILTSREFKHESLDLLSENAITDYSIPLRLYVYRDSHEIIELAERVTQRKNDTRFDWRNIGIQDPVSLSCENCIDDSESHLGGDVFVLNTKMG